MTMILLAMYAFAVGVMKTYAVFCVGVIQVSMTENTCQPLRLHTFSMYSTCEQPCTKTLDHAFKGTCNLLLHLY